MKLRYKIGLVASMLTLVTGVAASTASTASAATPALHAERSAAVAQATGTFDGDWTMTQSNGAIVSLVNGEPAGDGSFIGTAQTFDAIGASNGQVSGTDVVFQIAWSFGQTGRYTGHLGADGQWSGVTIDLNNPSSTATWTAHRS